MNKHNQVDLLILGTTFAFVLNACGSTKPSPTIATKYHTSTATYSSEASGTPILSSSPTATETLSPPDGSGKIIPQLTYDVITRIEDLPITEYLLVYVFDNGQPKLEALPWLTFDPYNLISILGGESTRFIGPPVLDSLPLRIFGYYLDDQFSNALYIFDLQNNDLFGFNFGCKAVGPILINEYPSYSCLENDAVFHFVSPLDWNYSFSKEFIKTQPDDMVQFRFSSSGDIYALQGNFEKGYDLICFIEEDKLMATICSPVDNFQSGYFSPDGKWLELQRRSDEETRFEIMTTDCLRDTLKSCDEIWIENAPFRHPGDVTPNVAWYPSSDKLLYLKAGCTGEDNTTFWTYDLGTKSTEIVGNYPACHTFVYSNGQPLWSPDGTGIVVERSGRGFYLFYPETGQMQQILSNDPPARIIGSFSVP